MGIAEQMLLNQVTIFNPQPTSSSSSIYHSSSSNTYREKSVEELKRESARYGLAELFGEETKSKYAFGWHDPRKEKE
jgi:hypothetical protein